MQEHIDSYKMIRQQIIDDIERGVYEPGDTIPKQMEFAERYGVSRGTVRKAVDDLIRRGVLITTKGKGTVVADYNSGVKDQFRPWSFSESKRVDKRTLESKTIEIRQIPAEPWLAKQLRISVGAPVVNIKRVRILDGIPENYQCSYISQAKIAGVNLEAVDLEHSSLFGAIGEATGLYAMMKNEEVRAVRCPDYVAAELQMQANDPVLLIMRTVYSQDNLPLEYCEDYECTDVKGLMITTHRRLEAGGMAEESYEE